MVFESVEDIDMSDGLKKRRADLKVCCVENNKHIYYELKSVMEVPPGNFNEQFAKDLLIDEVTNLNQFMWIFDGKKFPEGYDFKGKMEEGIEAVFNNSANNKVLKEAAKKILKSDRATKDALKSSIIENFDNIFKIE